MIPRKLARRFLAEYIASFGALTDGHEIGTREILESALRASADVFVEESGDVLRGAENKDQKARRYLTEGRITVIKMRDDGLIVAEARGSGETYHLGYDPRRKQWRCTCIARGKCSHVTALQLVVAAPKTT